MKSHLPALPVRYCTCPNSSSERLEEGHLYPPLVLAAVRLDSAAVVVAWQAEFVVRVEDLQPD